MSGQPAFWDVLFVFVFCFVASCFELCCLFLFLQHIPVVGSIFGDSFYDQQLASRQTNALSHQVTQNTQMNSSSDRNISLQVVLDFTLVYNCLVSSWSNLI